MTFCPTYKLNLKTWDEKKLLESNLSDAFGIDNAFVTLKEGLHMLKSEKSAFEHDYNRLVQFVGAENASGREIVEEHLDACIAAGLNIEGINGEVMKG